jgi:hypothetical protein
MNYIRLTVKASRTWADTIDDGWNGSVSSAPAGKGGPLGGHAVRTQSQTKETRKFPSLFWFLSIDWAKPKKKKKIKNWN